MKNKKGIWKRLKLMLMGTFAGIIGMGLQNLNPFEPYDLTHGAAVGVGCILMVGMMAIEPLVKMLHNMYLDYKGDNPVVKDSKEQP